MFFIYLNLVFFSLSLTHTEERVFGVSIEDYPAQLGSIPIFLKKAIEYLKTCLEHKNLFGERGDVVVTQSIRSALEASCVTFIFSFIHSLK
jgi:hypothetical protein